MFGVFSKLRHVSAAWAAFATLVPFSLALLWGIAALVYANVPAADVAWFDRLGAYALLALGACAQSFGVTLLAENLQRKRRYAHRYLSLFRAAYGYEEPSFFAAAASAILPALAGALVWLAFLWRGLG